MAINICILTGRLTKDPEVRYTADTQKAVATFSVAIDRPITKDGEKKTDYPRVTVFGKQAENCEKYIGKGRLVGVQGRLQTGSYTNKDGVTVYTTDVIADRIEFLDRGESKGTNTQADDKNGSQAKIEPQNATPEPQEHEYEALDFEIPF